MKSNDENKNNHLHEDEYRSKKDYFEKNTPLSKSDFANQIESSRLKSRKIKLFDNLLAYRLSKLYNNQIQKLEIEPKVNITLQEISNFLHGKSNAIPINCNLNSPNNLINDTIYYGLFQLDYYILNQNKIWQNDKKFIFENIYYRLLDLFIHNDKYKVIISKIFINFTNEDKGDFINALMKDDFISKISEILNNYYNCNIKDNNLNPLLSKLNNNEIDLVDNLIYLLSNIISENKSYMTFINKKIDIIKLIRKKLEIVTLNMLQDNENILYLFYNYIYYCSKKKYTNYLDIISILLTHFKKDYNSLSSKININNNNLFSNINNINIISTWQKNQNNSNSNEDIKKLDIYFDIFYLLLFNDSVNEFTLNSNILDIISDSIKSKNFYLVKSYKILSLLLIPNSNKQKIVDIKLYQNLNNNTSINKNLPFTDDINFYYSLLLNLNNSNLTNQKDIYRIINYLFQCIKNLIKNNLDFAKLYINNTDFVNIIKKLFDDCTTTLKIKNQIILIFYESFILGNQNIQNILISNNICNMIIMFLKNNLHVAKLNQQVIINCLCFINKCLDYSAENKKINYVKIECENLGFDDILEKLLNEENEDIEDKAREIYHKYWCEEENYYFIDENNKIRNNFYK